MKIISTINASLTFLNEGAHHTNKNDWVPSAIQWIEGIFWISKYFSKGRLILQSQRSNPTAESIGIVYLISNLRKYIAKTASVIYVKRCQDAYTKSDQLLSDGW